MRLLGCTFHRACSSIYCASLLVTMGSNRFEDGCRWEFERAAQATLDFLATLYRAGGTRLVEGIFDAIRGVRPQGRALM